MGGRNGSPVKNFPSNEEDGRSSSRNKARTATLPTPRLGGSSFFTSFFWWSDNKKMEFHRYFLMAGHHQRNLNKKKRCAFFCFYHEGLVNNSRGVKKGPRPDVFRQILFSAQWSHSESLEALLRFEVGVFEMKPLTKRNISVEAQPTCVYSERQRT